MISVDGKAIDLTKPETWGNAITLKPNGYVEAIVDGVVTIITQEQTANERPTHIPAERSARPRSEP